MLLALRIHLLPQGLGYICHWESYTNTSKINCSCVCTVLFICTLKVFEILCKGLVASFNPLKNMKNIKMLIKTWSKLLKPSNHTQNGANYQSDEYIKNKALLALNRLCKDCMVKCIFSCSQPKPHQWSVPEKVKLWPLRVLKKFLNEVVQIVYSTNPTVQLWTKLKDCHY